MKIRHPRFAPALSALCGLGLAITAIAPCRLGAEEATTTPLGAVPISIAAGTGTARTLSTISFPLLEDAVVAGQGRGRITGVTANTITNSNAGWTAGQLSTAAAPCLIQITSGAAAGRIFLISISTASTGTTLTIDSEEAGLVDLTTLGITTGASGDTYRILACDTLSSIFGTPAQTGVLGSTSSATADIVQIMVSGIWRQYYFNTTSNAWLRVGPNTPSNNVPIRPDALLVYSRLGASSINLTWLGQVPSISRKAIVRNSGLTALAGGWPLGQTLASSTIQNTPGWVTSSSPNTADIVQVLVSGIWRQYYHNGTQWLRVGPNTPSNTQQITAGTGVLVSKKGSTSGASILAQAIPYTF